MYAVVLKNVEIMIPLVLNAMYVCYKCACSHMYSKIVKCNYFHIEAYYLRDSSLGSAL